MKLCYSTWSMPKLPVDVIVTNLARIGFDSVELTVRPGWSTELDTLGRAERRRIRRLLDEHHLELPALAAHQPMLSRDPAAHAEHWRRLKGAIDLAAEWADAEGPPAIDTTAGGKSERWEEDRDLLVERTGELCDYAAGRGVVLGIEPHVSDVLDRVDRALWLLAQVNRPNLRLTFDISHFNVQGVAMEESVAALAPHAAFTHVKDERGVVPDYQFLIPGEGVFDYAGYLRAMQAAGYAGHIGVEISLMVQRRPDYDAIAAAEQSYRVLTRAFAESGVPRG